MLTFILSMLYYGGLIPAYRAARANGHSETFSLLIAMPLWPVDVGWTIASLYCRAEEE